jgi:outer membrane protein OmpA-like peptidoglycan-associated protein
MKNIPIKLIGLFFGLLLSQDSLYSQELEVSLFDEVNQSMQMANLSQADVLSPRAFEEAMDEYNAAQKEYGEDGELADIRKKIDKANIKFQKATENTKVSAVLFSSALSARSDALSAEADQFVNEMWTSAESEMKEAAEELEKGDSNDAKEKATVATSLYRKAELESIKANYLTNAKKLLQQADDNKVYKVAPKTMLEAQNLVSQAEKELLENRYDTDQARYLAKKAEYKVQLAMHIAKEEKILDDKDFETEDYLLMSYQPLSRIGESLNIDMKFDNGIDLPVSGIIMSITSEQLRTANLEANLYSQRMTNENLQAMLDEQQITLENMEVTLSDEALALQTRIDRMEVIDSKFEQIQQIFNDEEAQVFRQKNDVIIRMIGVNFDVGKAQIQQEDYTLLTKVQEAMDLFQEASIAIEGHTDSQGGDELNLTLSQERADAVLDYLNANTSVDKTRFSTKGFGESRPVANNETLAGRKLNRRIDIVIKPTFQEVPG